MLKNRSILFLTIGLLFGFVLARFAFNRSSPTPSPAMTNLTDKQPTNIITSTINDGDTPECNLGRCPEYLSEPWYINGEWPAASVVIVPVTMTKGGGSVWIIHQGKVVYKSSVLAEVSAKLKDDHLYINYVSEWNGVTPKTWETDELKYQDGKFEMVKIK